MSARIIYLTDNEFEIVSKQLQMGGIGYDNINLEHKIIFMRDKFMEKEIPIKHTMTRAEIIAKLRNEVFGLTDTGQAAKWADFFITAGMLEVEEEEEKPIFEIHTHERHIQIWANGKIHGIEGTIINRIPQYMAKNNS